MPRKEISRLQASDLSSELVELYERLGREPINLHLALAEKPRMLAPLLHLIQELRYGCGCPRKYRELAICQVMRLRDSDYGWAHHQPMALAAGLTAGQLQALDRWRESELFDDTERVVLGYTDHMVNDLPFDTAILSEHFSDAEQVELTLTVSIYLAITAVVKGLDVKIDSNLAV